MFIISTNTLINATTIGRLSTKEPEFHNAGLDIYEEPKEGRYYAMACDTARGIGGDYSAFVVVDITQMPYKVVAKYRDNSIAPMLFPDVIGKVGRDYNNAFILVEVNDIGQQVAEILHQEVEYENIYVSLGLSQEEKSIIKAQIRSIANWLKALAHRQHELMGMDLRDWMAF